MLFPKSNQGTSLITVMLAVAFIGISSLTIMDVASLSYKTQGNSVADRQWDIIRQNLEFIISTTNECDDVFQNNDSSIRVLDPNYLATTPVSVLKWRGKRFISSGQEVGEIYLHNRTNSPAQRTTSTAPIEVRNQYVANLTIVPKVDMNRVTKKSLNYMLNIETRASDNALRTCYLKSCTVTNPPSARPDTVEVSKGQSTLINVLANDSVEDPLNYPMVLVKVSTPLHGVATIVGTQVKYLANDPTFFGQEILNYTISDGCQDASTDIKINVVPQINLTVSGNFLGDNPWSSIPLTGMYDGLSGGKYVSYTGNGTQPVCSGCSSGRSDLNKTWPVGCISSFSPNTFTVGSGGDTTVKMIICESDNSVVAKSEFKVKVSSREGGGHSSTTIPAKNLWINMIAGGGGGGGLNGDNGGGGGGSGASVYLFPITFSSSSGVVSWTLPDNASGGGTGHDGANGGNSTFTYPGGVINLEGGRGGRGATATSGGAGGDGGSVPGYPGKSGGAPGLAGEPTTTIVDSYFVVGAGGGGGAKGDGVTNGLETSGNGGAYVASGAFLGNFGKGCHNTVPGGPGGGGAGSPWGLGGCGVCSSCTDNSPYGSKGSGGGGNVGDAYGISYSRTNKGGRGYLQMIYIELQM